MFLSALGIYYSISSLILRVDDLMISSGTVVNDCIFKLGLRIHQDFSRLLAQFINVNIYNC